MKSNLDYIAFSLPLTKMHPLISVIVPVYNVQKYLRQCIASILAQTYENFELILVNDGSKDKSGEICDEYAKKDNRIKVFHKENGGVSSARNLGLDKAIGENICFVDSDDWVDENYLEILTSEHEVPFVVAPVTSTVIESGIFVGKHNIYKKVVEAEVAHDFIFRAPVSKLYDTSIIKEANLRFREDLQMGEDYIFNLNYMLHIECMKVGAKLSGYHHRHVEGSLTHSDMSTDERLRIANIFCLETKKIGKILKKDELFHSIFAYEIQNCFFYSYRKMKQRSDRLKVILYWKETIDPLTNRYLKKIYKPIFFLKSLPINIIDIILFTQFSIINIIKPHK